MEDRQPLLHNDTENKPSKVSKSWLFQCTCIRVIKLIEFSLMALQIVSVILDWPSYCNRSAHIWMIVSLSYRLGSFIFQWICIEPCLRYLRRDRSNKVEETNSWCWNGLFCWIIPWLWIIDNDIFLLIWTIIGTVLLFEYYTDFTPLKTCNLKHVYNNTYSHIFYYTMLIVLGISYLYWITTLFISLSLLCCPQKINSCCLKMGYTIAKPKGMYVHRNNNSFGKSKNEDKLKNTNVCFIGIRTRTD